MRRIGLTVPIAHTGLTAATVPIVLEATAAIAPILQEAIAATVLIHQAVIAPILLEAIHPAAVN